MNEKFDFYVQPYQYNAFADLIIQKHPDYNAYVNNNFIQIIGMNSINEDIGIFVDYLCGNVYGRLPLLNVTDYSYLKNKDKQQTIQLIKNGLKGNKKYYLFLDHFYIENTTEYQKRHFQHDILLLSNENGFFRYLENVNGYILEYVIEEKNFFYNFYSHNNSHIFELTYNTNERYYFELDRFLQMLNDYTYGNKVNNMKLYLPECGFYSNNFFDGRINRIDHWGINVYDIIAQRTSNSVKNHSFIDYRAYYIMFEKNQNLIKKLDYCIKERHIRNYDFATEKKQLKELCTDLQNMMYRAIKYNYRSHQLKGIEKLATEVLEIKKTEQQILKNIIDNSHFNN